MKLIPRCLNILKIFYFSHLFLNFLSLARSVTVTKSLPLILNTNSPPPLPPPLNEDEYCEPSACWCYRTFHLPLILPKISTRCNRSGNLIIHSSAMNNLFPNSIIHNIPPITSPIAISRSNQTLPLSNSFIIIEHINVLVYLLIPSILR